MEGNLFYAKLLQIHKPRRESFSRWGCFFEQSPGRWAMKQLIPAEKPWVICRLGVKSTNRVIRRYTNRQDAEDDLRVMTRFVKDGGQYVVAFDVIEIEE